MLRWTFVSCLLATASGFGVALQHRRPLLPAQRRQYAPVSVIRMQAELAAVPEEPSTPPTGLKSRVAAMLPPKQEMKKLVRRCSAALTIRHIRSSARAARLTCLTHRSAQVPLAMMFFCILFSYTILRDTKDVLVRASSQPLPALDRPCDSDISGTEDRPPRIAHTPPCMPPQQPPAVRCSEIKFCGHSHPAETPHAQLAGPP